MKYKIYNWYKARNPQYAPYHAEPSTRNEVAMLMTFSELADLERRALAVGKATQSTLFNVDVTVTREDRPEAEADYQQTINDFLAGT